MFQNFGPITQSIIGTLFTWGLTAAGAALVVFFKETQNFGPITQSIIGTLFTWGLTAAGAALVVFFKETQQRLLDCSLGFAAGVMLAASYWSLLEPAIEMAKDSKMFGPNGELSFIPVAIGFSLGAFFVYIADICISHFNLDTKDIILSLKSEKLRETKKYSDVPIYSEVGWTTIDGFSESTAALRKRAVMNGEYNSRTLKYTEDNETSLGYNYSQWKRMLLLIVAITIHNIPEGLAVGVAFGAIGSSPVATFESASLLLAIYSVFTWMCLLPYEKKIARFT